jgi:hypothetical protein
MGFIKNVFLNQFVLHKGTLNQQYVNSPRFFACAVLETMVYDYLKPVFGLELPGLPVLHGYCRRL